MHEVPDAVVTTHSANSELETRNPTSTLGENPVSEAQFSSQKMQNPLKKEGSSLKNEDDSAATNDESSTTKTPKTQKESSTLKSTEELKQGQVECVAKSLTPSKEERANPTLTKQDTVDHHKDHHSQPCPDDGARITFKYITLDLLKRAANSHRKSALSSLMSSLELKGSSNVTNNKKKMCNFLEIWRSYW